MLEWQKDLKTSSLQSYTSKQLFQEGALDMG